jgi:hypothetical protein
MKRFLSAILLSSLAACGTTMITKKDVVGKFCAQPSSSVGDEQHHHTLLLSEDGKYHYSTSSSAPTPSIDMAGAYRIYGPPPVERIELKGICFQPGSKRCGDYPADVTRVGGQLEIMLEDSQGTPIALKKCQ